MKSKMVIKTIISLLMVSIMTGITTITIAKSQSIENHNKEVLGKVEILQKLAEEYIQKNNITDQSSTTLCMQYIRKDKYYSGLWKMILGSIDTEFITYVESKENAPTFKDEVLFDPSSGKEIDFIHMIAALDAYLKNGDIINNSISTHYAGWAGDLTTLLEEVTEYRVENNIEGKDKLQEYSNSILGTNIPSTFSSSDILADLDAIALYKDNSNNKVKENLYSALYSYYVKNDSIYNSNNRLHTAQTILGATKESVKEKAKSLLENTNILSMLFQNKAMTSYVIADDIDVVSQSFANYVHGVPYMKLQENQGTAILGKSIIDVKIIESNANPINIEIENNKIAKAEIYGEYLRITPLDIGKTNIIVYSQDRSVSSTYELISQNIAPSITENLDETYQLTANMEKTFSIKANGTNNIYTWYVKDSIDGTFKKVAESSENTYKILPTLEMNNTYIRVGVKNNGNEEIFSVDAKIIVSDMQKEEENQIAVYPNAGIHKSILSIIPFVLLLNIILYKKLKKYKEI